jgi:7,8-dihydro-6-hydroxymethylpterin dimethyltransferase
MDTSLFSKLEQRYISAGRPLPTNQQRLAASLERVPLRFRTPGQALGVRWPIGCVSLEVTQRCNLDCTLCYLSEMSEATLDIPMVEVKRRIDEIFWHYGPRTAVQVSGGDPTLRNHDELVEIVRYIAALEMQPALFTNGIKASRELIERLVEVGLTDVAFHVDMTQRLRKPDKSYYSTEEELHSIRQQYIERVRGIKVAIVFNTTIFRDNIHELDSLVQFFKRNADVVGMASFQLGADTGRGEIRGRVEEITPDNVVRIINRNMDTPINFDAMDIGHRECNRVGYSLVSDNTSYDLWLNPERVFHIAKYFEGISLDRRNPAKAAITLLKFALLHPVALVVGLPFVLTHIWRMKGSLLRSGCKVYKQSFFIHNFMHADALDAERVEACSFMVITADGPMSMCAHNAHRDHFITKPLSINVGTNQEEFNPVRQHRQEEWNKKKDEVAQKASNDANAKVFTV